MLGFLQPESQNDSSYLKANKLSATGNAFDKRIDLGTLAVGEEYTIKVYVNEIVGTEFFVQLGTIFGWKGFQQTATPFGSGNY